MRNLPGRRGLRLRLGEGRAEEETPVVGGRWPQVG